jgi:hypothetical protein
VGAHRAVIIGRELESLEPRFRQFLLQFAADNDLCVTCVEGCARLARSDRTAAFATSAEPREPA